MGELVAKNGECRSCGAKIFWLKQELEGKFHIANPPKKLFVLNQKGFFQLEDCFESHFTTCPQASSWRKKKEG